MLYHKAIQADSHGPPRPNCFTSLYLHFEGTQPRLERIKCSRYGGMNIYKDRNTKKIYGWTPASLVRCSTTEVSRPIAKVNLTQTTTHQLVQIEKLVI